MPSIWLGATVGALAAGAELLTCLTGLEPPVPDDDVAALVPGDVELELSDGGQPAWWWLLAAE